MILFYAPAPQLFPHEGMLRRIAYIDKLFNDVERIYCYPASFLGEQVTYVPTLKAIDERVSVFPMDFSYSAHRECFVNLMQQSNFLYAHTVHSAQYLYPFYDSGKIITDLHGIAPEEERMFGNKNRGDFYEFFEKEMIKKSYRVIGVSHAMFLHYQHKYNLSEERFLLLPISDEMPPCQRKTSKNMYNVIYAGNIQVWQNVDLMLKAVLQSTTQYTFTFLTHQKEVLRDIARKVGVVSRIEIASCAASELPEWYAKATFGFILRDDTAVNTVSCPTKLVEYAACDIVPITLSESLGDFQRLGGRSISLERFLTQDKFSEEELEEIRVANRIFIENLRRIIFEGARDLIQIPLPVSCFDQQDWKMLALDSKTQVQFPLQALWSIQHEGGEEIVKTEGDLCWREFTLTLDITEKMYGENISLSFMGKPLIIEFKNIDIILDGRRRKAAVKYFMQKQNTHFLSTADENYLVISRESFILPASIELNCVVHAIGEECAPLMYKEKLEELVRISIERDSLAIDHDLLCAERDANALSLARWNRLERSVAPKGSLRRKVLKLCKKLVSR